MAYNPYGAPGYGPPPSYGSYPGASAPPGMAPPPGLGPPPGMSAPGMAPPGVQQPSITQANRPSGLPASFQPPTNMPDINFNAPVIRLGTSGSKSSAPGPGPGRKDDGPGLGGRPGLGADRPDQGRSSTRESIMALVPPTKDEIIRTVFVGAISEGTGGNAGIERLMGTAGKLKRWDRAIGSDGKELPFGFAQFEDIESLAVAVEVLKDIEVPTKKQTPADGPAPDDDDFAEFDKTKLQFTVDQASLDYLDTYKESRGDDAVPESRIQTAKSLLKQAVRDLFYPPLRTAQDADGDIAMGDTSAPHGENVEVVNIPLAQEDELADIPAEMRETVAAEIAAFRDRSHQRDLERLRQEEEFEAAERARNGQPRPSRLDSPPPQSSNIPLGPRGVVPNAPSGPRGQRVAFVNGGAQNGDISINRDDDDTDASDEELYRREVSKKEAEEEKLFLEAERRWVNRERSRAAALEREKEREEAELEKERKNREIMAERFKNWDDDREAARKSELYYRDRSAWIRERTAFRARETAQDEADRKAEERERAKEEAEKEQARGQADSFLERQAQEMQEREAAVVSAPQPFKLKLKMQPQRAGPKRRTVAEVEGLLEDEEDQSTTRRQLIPIEPSATTQLSEEENQQAVRALAQEIPSDKDGLWAWDIKWEHLDETAIEEKLRPFVEKKIVDYLGVQEQMLVDMVEEHLRKKSRPDEMIGDLNEALDTAEAEDLVKKVWRMVIFYTECEKRGLSA